MARKFEDVQSFVYSIEHIKGLDARCNYRFGLKEAFATTLEHLNRLEPGDERALKRLILIYQRWHQEAHEGWQEDMRAIKDAKKGR